MTSQRKCSPRNRAECRPAAPPPAEESRYLPRCHEGLREGWCGDRPVGHVMAWGSPNSSSSVRSRAAHLLLTLLVIAMTVNCAASSKAGSCKADLCTRHYHEAMAQNRLAAPEPSATYCHVLNDYGTCIKSTARTCRGNLNYHSTTSLVTHYRATSNCSQLLAVTAPGRTPLPSSRATPVPEPPQPSPTAPIRHPHHHKQCTFQGRHKFRHCGLFGDPHLKTFENEYQTCRVRGAWPLIDNPFLGVQVTNEPVVDGSPATATTKVTVLVRGRATSCTPEKTYEAQADLDLLPTLFIDGTQRSGPDENVVLSVHDQGSRVEIYVRYIETTLVVRKVGRYLAFSARMPEELLQARMNDRDQDGDSLQLCVRGCPPSERLDPVSARGHALPWEAAVARCRKADSYNNEVSPLNLTDHYLDWCVFDVMTTGDGVAADDFTAAAHSAQADVLRLDPSSLNNRTTTLQFPDGWANSASRRHHSLLLPLLLLLKLLADTRV